MTIKKNKLIIVLNFLIGKLFHLQDKPCVEACIMRNLPSLSSWNIAALQTFLIFPGMMIESMAGKSAALHGLCHDATPFTFSEEQPAVDFFGKLLTAGRCRSSMIIISNKR